MRDQLHTTAELAGVLGVSPDVIRKLTREGQIPVVRVGGANRYDLAAVRMALTRQASKIAGAPAVEIPKAAIQLITQLAEETGVPPGVIVGRALTHWVVATRLEGAVAPELILRARLNTVTISRLWFEWQNWLRSLPPDERTTAVMPVSAASRELLDACDRAAELAVEALGLPAERPKVAPEEVPA